jgi:hypothetical protein
LIPNSCCRRCTAASSFGSRFRSAATTACGHRPSTKFRPDPTRAVASAPPRAPSIP